MLVLELIGRNIYRVVLIDASDQSGIPAPNSPFSTGSAAVEEF